MINRDIKKYPLGKKFQGVILNYHEAMCIRYLFKKWNLRSIAKQLNLSPRTVMFYIGNMMLQLKCETVRELLELIKQSEFLRHIDF